MDEVKTLNEQKKEYLGKYQSTVRRIARIEAEIQEIRDMKRSISAAGNDGMPRGSGQSDLSTYAAELDGYERELIQERYTRIKLYKDISQRIRKLKSKNENDVMFYHYIKGLEWYEIAEKMNYSERHILRIHGKALAHLQLSEKDVSECQ